ncbi:hypothetical protein [Nakamurella endophytica]|uniref:Glycosyltransferase n=1 Tax=Nakamurella endophytica TaxID=1748367 RepID=A0A917SNE9_9ACTN|nr:hypothetical protein [Nakamurella endophytica]GGL87412.1 hypothetical protein GCM10011594_03730 [Nakamurella endophytica]
MNTAVPAVRRMAGRGRRLARRLRTDPSGAWRTIRVRTRMAVLRAVNRWSPRPVVGTGQVVVNLTTYGHRADTAFYAIESIGLGSVRPRRLILWLDDPAILAHPPRSLDRLQRRGLELLPCPDFGPHNKQYPYAVSTSRHDLPLVAADDDMLYPRRWLRGLVAAYREAPDVINCYRAHLLEFDGDHLRPYLEWTPRTGRQALLSVFPTGVSGVIYPPALLDRLAAAGTGFLQVAPRADDIWVHAVAVANGIRTRQLGDRQQHFTAVPGTQIGTLYRANVREGGNDRQIAAAYSDRLLRPLIEERRPA